MIRIAIAGTVFNRMYDVEYADGRNEHELRVRAELERAPSRKHSRGRVYELSLSIEDWEQVAEALDVRELIGAVDVSVRPEYRAVANVHDKIIAAIAKEHDGNGLIRASQIPWSIDDLSVAEQDAVLERLRKSSAELLERARAAVRSRDRLYAKADASNDDVAAAEQFARDRMVEYAAFDDAYTAFMRRRRGF